MTNTVLLDKICDLRSAYFKPDYPKWRYKARRIVEKLSNSKVFTILQKATMVTLTLLSYVAVSALWLILKTVVMLGECAESFLDNGSIFKEYKSTLRSINSKKPGEVLFLGIVISLGAALVFIIAWSIFGSGIAASKLLRFFPK